MTPRRFKISSQMIWRFLGSGVIVTLLMGLLQIFTGYDISERGRDSKVLRPTILANSSLLEVDKTIRDNIKISYKNSSIDNLSFVEMGLENIGNREIREDDYEKGQPLQLIFPKEVNILDAVVSEKRPEDVEMKVQHKQNQVSLSPALLNQRDRVTIKVFLTNMPTGNAEKLISLQGRIKGGSIQPISTEQKEFSGQTKIDWINYFVVLLIGLGIGFISFKKTTP